MGESSHRPASNARGSVTTGRFGAEPRREPAGLAPGYVPSFTSRAPKALGALLVESGLLTEAQLEAAIARQQSTGRRLGHVLVELGFVTADAVLAALGQQLGVPTARVNAYTVNTDAIVALPEKVARRHTAFPLQKLGTTLLVALATPGDLGTIDDLRFASGC